MYCTTTIGRTLLCKVLSGIAIAQRATLVTAFASKSAGDLRVADENMVGTEHADQPVDIQSAPPSAIAGTAMGVDDPALLAQFTQSGDGDDVHVNMDSLRNVTPCPRAHIRRADGTGNRSEDVKPQGRQFKDAAGGGAWRALPHGPTRTVVLDAPPAIGQGCKRQHRYNNKNVGIAVCH